MESLPRVAVVGVGAVGGIVAAALESAQKCVVTLVARGRSYEKLKSHGLRVRTFEGEDFRYAFENRIVHTADRPLLAERKQDYVLCCTKAHQLPAVVDVVGDLSGPNTVVVPCTNGLPWWYYPLRSTDPTGNLGERMDTARVLGCVGMISGGVRGEYDRWETHWPSERNTLMFGEPHGGTGSRASFLASLFDGGDVAVAAREVHDIRSRIFDKLLINCSINSIGALGRADCGQTCGHPSSANLLSNLVGEATAVAEALDPPVRLTHTADSILQHYTGQHGLRSSMLQDVLAQRPLEHNQIVRSLVELGSKHGVQTPRLEAVADLLDTVENYFPVE